LKGAQRDMIDVLLGSVFERGLISETAYRSARNLLVSAMDFPNLLGYPVCLTKEATGDGTP
jgi:hypothetical protein